MGAAPGNGTEISSYLWSEAVMISVLSTYLVVVELVGHIFADFLILAFVKAGSIEVAAVNPGANVDVMPVDKLFAAGWMGA